MQELDVDIYWAMEQINQFVSISESLQDVLLKLLPNLMNGVGDEIKIVNAKNGETYIIARIR